MTEEEFKINVEQLFSEYSCLDFGWNTNLNQINVVIKTTNNYIDDLILIINNESIIHNFYLSKPYTKCYYKSSYFDNFETELDELVLFKELILPKYL